MNSTTMPTVSSYDVKSALSLEGCSIAYCPIDHSSITVARCKELSSNPSYNPHCIKHKCTSKYKVCPTCLKHGEVIKMGHIEPICCERGKAICKFHRITGDYRRTDGERKNEIKTYEEEMKKRTQMITGVAASPEPEREKPIETEKPFVMPVTMGEARKQSEIHQRRLTFIKQAVEKNKAEKVEQPDPVPSPVATQISAQAEVVKITVMATSNLKDVIVDAPEQMNQPVKLGVGEVLELHEVDESGVVTSISAEVISEVFQIAWEDIQPYKLQPRKNFDQAKLKQLAGSIEEEGQLMPVLVCASDNEKHKWELVDGERRYRACQMIGRKMMSAILVKVKDEKEQHRKSFIANFCREGHTPMETANSIRRVMDDYEFTVARTAKILGKSDTWVEQHLSLLNLHPEIQSMLDPELPKSERLRYTVATYIAQVKDQDVQLALAKEILDADMKTGKAYAHVRSRMRAIGQQSTKKRTPRDDYRVLVSAVQRTTYSVKNYTEMGKERLQALFRFRSETDKAALLDELDAALQEMNQLKEMLCEAK